MELGAFSISLKVRDIHISKSFYEKLGFQATAGDLDQNWVIMKNRDIVIGLFQGMFEQNILTFNPGWDQNGNPLASFTDIRDLQRILKGKGVEFETQADENQTGPASFMIIDPDGNPILIDQHV